MRPGFDLGRATYLISTSGRSPTLETGLSPPTPLVLRRFSPAVIRALSPGAVSAPSLDPARYQRPSEIARLRDRIEGEQAWARGGGRWLALRDAHFVEALLGSAIRRGVLAGLGDARRWCARQRCLLPARGLCSCHS